MNLDDYTQDDLIVAVQDYQELVSDLEGEVNKALIDGKMIDPLKVRALIMKWAHGNENF